VLVGDWFGAGEIDVGRRDVVEIVGEDIERHASDDLGDGAVVETSRTDVGEIGIADLPARVNQFAREPNQLIGLGVDRRTVPTVADLVGRESDRLADGRVSNEP
jgi:hypothetical protein